MDLSSLWKKFLFPETLKTEFDEIKKDMMDIKI